MSYPLKHIVWDEERTNRLYDFIAVNKKEDTFFGYQVGEAIVHLCSYFVDDLENMKVLDYGSGMGHIINYFLRQKANVFGVDLSEGEVSEVNKRYGENPNFGGVRVYDGVRLPFDDDEFELITCTECIEHVLDKHMDNVMTELYRILKPGGIIVFTTPNEENMSNNEMCCPECSTVFHKWGHVRNFSRESLTNLLNGYGFKSVLCDSTDFGYVQKYLSHPSIMDLSLRQMKYRLGMKYISFIDGITGKKHSVNGRRFQKYIGLKRKPNLFFVGTK